MPEKGFKLSKKASTIKRQTTDAPRQTEAPPQRQHGSEDSMCHQHRCPACQEQIARNRQSVNVGGKVMTYKELRDVEDEWVSRGLIR